MIEFAMVLPVLLLIAALVVDLGLAYHSRLLLTRGVAAGTYYASGHAGDLSSSNEADIAQNIATLVRGVTGPNVTVTVLANGVVGTTNADTFYCLNGGIGSMTGTGASSVTCPDATTSGKFVTVHGSMAYVSPFPAITSKVADPMVGETITVRVR